jgi:hypothetical protein
MSISISEKITVVVFLKLKLAFGLASTNLIHVGLFGAV